MKVKLLYFARLREAFDMAEEEVVLPAEVASVSALVAWLRSRGGAWAAELAPGRAYRVAVNQEMAHAETALPKGVDGIKVVEVAVFPPVTGG